VTSGDPLAALTHIFPALELKPETLKSSSSQDLMS